MERYSQYSWGLTDSNQLKRRNQTIATFTRRFHHEITLIRAPETAKAPKSDECHLHAAVPPRNWVVAEPAKLLTRGFTGFSTALNSISRF